MKAKQKKGVEYVCGICGTTMVITEDGVGLVEDIVCCEKPMKRKKTTPSRVKPKKKAGRKAKK